MQAYEIIGEDIPTLSPAEPCQKASAWMDEYKMTHLPVVENGKFLGMISDSSLFEVENWDDSLQQHQDLFEHIAVDATDHVTDVARKMAADYTSCVAIIDAHAVYQGNVSIYRLTEIIGAMSLISDIGGIIELEVNIVDYSMSEISQIVESNNARILGSYIKANPDSKKLNVTIKLNRRDTAAIVSTFERYDYAIVGNYKSNPNQDNLRDRFDNLMNFINM